MISTLKSYLSHFTNRMDRPKFNKAKSSGNSSNEANKNFKKKPGYADPKPEEVEDEDAMEFSDSFEDEWEEEDVVPEEESHGMELESDLGQSSKKKNVVVPFLGNNKELNEGEVLEVDNSAYKMFHRCSTEWPCLSIDFIADTVDFSSITPRDFSTGRTDFEYPLDVYAVGGSQADTGSQNAIYLMRFAGLSVTQHDDDEDVNESFEEVEPKLFYEKVPVKAGTNRSKAMMKSPIVAVMNENAQLQIHDLRNSLTSLKKRRFTDPVEVKSKVNIVKQFMLQEEGFALEWSPMVVGKLACGLNNGQVHVFEPADPGMSDLVQSKSPIWTTKKSIEDLQFSPNQDQVLAACSSDGTVRIYDLRAPAGPETELVINAHDCDVNVISWNKKSPVLIASGADDGSFKVWDLRYIGQQAITSISWHKGPIYSIEWQPHDEWTLAVASGDNRMSIWDFSVEKDDEEADDPNLQHVPDNMLFLHQGQEDLKDVKWHPVYQNVMMTSAFDGYNVFQPGIDEEDSDVDSPNDLELIPDEFEDEVEM